MNIVDLIFDKVLYAKVIPADVSVQGVHFISSPDDNLQVGYMGHSAGHEIQPHSHLPIRRIFDRLKWINYRETLQKRRKNWVGLLL